MSTAQQSEATELFLHTHFGLLFERNQKVTAGRVMSVNPRPSIRATKK